MASNAGLIDSQKMKLKFIPMNSIEMKDGFWKPRMDKNHQQGIPLLLKHLEDHGVVENFMLVSGRKQVERKGPYFSDSDLFKWMEGAALDYQTYKDPEMKAELDRIIDEVVAAQGEDGYLNTFFQGELYNQRFRNLAREHELYCAGHLFQAAVAHCRATGEDKLLNAACRYADYMVETFGYDKKIDVDGHPEVEMALIELYRVTGKETYLELAEFFLTQLKFKEMPELKGHAVRAMYTCCGGTDYFAETGDQDYEAAGTRLWDDLVSGKMYITGGFGSRYAAEATGFSYELPNLYAYAETCAAIANAMWQYRLLGIYADAKYADEIERALYNGVISGISLDGKSYFYKNPLASAGTHARQEWYGCTCCPTNMVRLLASIPNYMYSVSKEGLWVHLFDNSKVNYKLEDGTPFILEQTTNYPWSGQINLKLTLDRPKQFTLNVRIPGWCQKASVKINGSDAGIRIVPGTYAAINRQWSAGDEITIDFDMPVVLMESDPRVRENYGNVAVTRGPLVYCAETPDNPEVSILELQLKSDRIEELKTDELGGVVMLKGSGVTAEPSAVGGSLYRRAGQVNMRNTSITFVPYYAWCNRGTSHMTVWMPYLK